MVFAVLAGAVTEFDWPVKFHEAIWAIEGVMSALNTTSAARKREKKLIFMMIWSLGEAD